MNEFFVPIILTGSIALAAALLLSFASAVLKPKREEIKGPESCPVEKGKRVAVIEHPKTEEDMEVLKEYDYDGIQSCEAAARLFNGPENCKEACMGFGDCAAVCPEGAISIEDGKAAIDKEKCTGCGACAKICPKGLIRLA